MAALTLSKRPIARFCRTFICGVISVIYHNVTSDNIIYHNVGF